MDVHYNTSQNNRLLVKFIFERVRNVCVNKPKKKKKIITYTFWNIKVLMINRLSEI